MKLQRLHARMADFCANAEAVADATLRRPVMRGDDVQLVEQTPRQWGGTEAQITLGGQVIKGFTKTGTYREATTELYVGLVATMLGAPSASYLLLGNCPRSEADRRYNQIETIRLFSAPSFDAYDYYKTSQGFDMKGVDAASLGAVAQFSMYIRETDSFETNLVHSVPGGQFASFDHEDAMPQDRLPVVARRTRRLLRTAARSLPDDAGRQAFAAGADEMAARIHDCPDALLMDSAALMAAEGWDVPPEIVAGMRARRNLFRRGAILPKTLRR